MGAATSGLRSLFESLMAKSAEKGALERVGAEFLQGAERPGTFTQGREFAKTPEGLAAQFEWGVPEAMGNNRGGVSMYRYADPDSSLDRAAFSFPADYKTLYEYRGMEGIRPHIMGGGMPADGVFYGVDTAGLDMPSKAKGAFGRSGSSQGAGVKAYGTIYGHILNDPRGINYKDELKAPNVHRLNYNMASAYMRDPSRAKRLLTTPEQFAHLPVDAGNFYRAAPETQVGTLQTEGALQALRRLNSAAAEPSAPAHLRAALESLPERLSSRTSPYELSRMVSSVRGLDPYSRSTGTLGPRALRRLGIVADRLQGREVDPAAFRGLEYKDGGKVEEPTRVVDGVYRGGDVAPLRPGHHVRSGGATLQEYSQRDPNKPSPWDRLEKGVPKSMWTDMQLVKEGKGWL